MVLTSSNDIELGTEAPFFSLPDPSGKVFTRDELRGERGFFVAFICNHCPYVKHLKTALATVSKHLQDKGIGVVAINANDVDSYPLDSPELMLQDSNTFGYTFPYLFDDTQVVARNYEAACTPDFFLYDHNLKLFYHGQFDDSRPGNDLPVDGADISEAVDRMLTGQPVLNAKPSIGCNIKWKS